jgi:hypothetical protein
MPERTDVDATESFDLSEVSDADDVDVAHFELDEPKDVRISESLGEGIHLEDVEYVLGIRVETELDEEDKALRSMQSDDYDSIEDVEDEITVAEVIHSDESGDDGIKLLHVETEDSLDEIIDRFAESDTNEGDD